MATNDVYPIRKWYFVAASLNLNGTFFEVPIICASSNGVCTKEILSNGIIDTRQGLAVENVRLTIGNCPNATGSPSCPYATYNVRFYNVIPDCPNSGQYCSSTDTPFLNNDLIFYMPLLSHETVGGWLGKNTFLSATPLPFTGYYFNPDIPYRYSEKSCPPGTYFNGVLCDNIPNLLKIQKNVTQFGFVPVNISITDEWTIDGWVITTKATDNGLASLFGLGTNTTFYEVRYQNSNIFSIGALTNTTSVNSATVTIPPFNNNWHYVTLILKNNTPTTAFQCILYVWNDLSQQPIQTSINTTAISAAIYNPLAYLTLGGNFNDYSLNHSLLYVKHIRLWREALNESSLKIYARNALFNPQNIPSLLLYLDFSTDNTSYFNNLAQQPPFDHHFSTFVNLTTNPNFYPPPYLVSMFSLQSITTPKDVFTCPLNFRYDNNLLMCVRTEGMYQDNMQNLVLSNQAIIQVPLLISQNTDDWTLELWIKILKYKGTSNTIISSDFANGLSVLYNGIQNQFLITFPVYGGGITSITLTKLQGISFNNWMHLELISNSYMNYYTACITQNCLSVGAKVNKTICQAKIVIGDSNSNNDLAIGLREIRYWNTPRSINDIALSFHK